jgi:hypothetical protein
MKVLYLLLVLSAASLSILLPTVCCGGEYVIVMSKNDCLCEHMLKLYNTDIRKYGKVKYENHKEFNWVKWEDKRISIIGAGGVMQDLDAKIAFFDLNNDSKDEAIIYEKGSLSNAPTDYYDVFNFDDIAVLNNAVDGRAFYKRALKSFSSSEGAPLEISDLSEGKALKKLPEKLKSAIQAAKKRGEKYMLLGNAAPKINFLTFENRFFITFEESSNADILATALDRFYEEGGDPRTSRRSNEWLVEGFSELEKYSIVSEYSKDNSLNAQCLYVRRDKPAKRAVEQLR